MTWRPPRSETQRGTYEDIESSSYELGADFSVLLAAGACAKSVRDQDGLATSVGPFRMTLPINAFVDYVEGPDFDRFDIRVEDVPSFVVSLYLGYAPSFPLLAEDVRQEESLVDGLRVRRTILGGRNGHACIEDALFGPLDPNDERVPQESLHLWFHLDDPRACDLARKVVASVGRVSQAAIRDREPRPIGSLPRRADKSPRHPVVHAVSPNTCRNGFGPPEDARYSLYVLCDDALGTTIGIARTELGESPFPSWPLADRFWQDEVWCRDVTSYVWLPDHVLLVATSSVYGSGGLYELRVEDRNVERLLAQASTPGDVYIQAYDPLSRRVDLLIETADGARRMEFVILP